MSGVTQSLRWGDKLNSMLLLFSTPELRELGRVSRRMIADYTKSYMQGEVYNPALMVFERFNYIFVLQYDYKAREWVLELDSSMDYPPPTNSSPPRRRSNSKSKGAERAAEGTMPARRRRPPRAVLRTTARAVLRRIARSHAYATWKTFLDDASARQAHDLPGQLAHVVAAAVRCFVSPMRACVLYVETGTYAVTSRLLRTQARPRHAPVGAASRTLIELYAHLPMARRSFGDRKLVRMNLKGPLAFIGELFIFERQSFEGLWDSALFGELPQPSEQIGR